MSRKQKKGNMSDPDSRVRDMNWEEFEARLSRSARGGKSRAASDQELRDHFGPKKLERLQQLAERVRSARQTKFTHRSGI